MDRIIILIIQNAKKWIFSQIHKTSICESQKWLFPQIHIKIRLMRIIQTKLRLLSYLASDWREISTNFKREWIDGERGQ